MAQQLTLPKMMAYAAHLCNAGEWDKAIPVLNACLTENSEFLDALYNLGVCYANLGDFSQALVYYHRVLRRNGLDVEANYNVGVAHQELENVDAAIQAYQRTLEIDDRYLAAWANLAHCFHERGIKTFRTGVESCPPRDLVEPLKNWESFMFLIHLGQISGSELLKLAPDAVADLEMEAKCLDEAMLHADARNVLYELQCQRRRLSNGFGI
jgi:tetratricopeptide (TPR) repeat protein